MSFWGRAVNSRSRVFAMITGAFCFGVLVGPLALFIRYDVLLASAIVFGAVALVLRSRRTRIALLILVAILLGASRYAQSFPPEGVVLVGDETDRAVRVSGVVEGEVERRENGSRATLGEILIADAPVHGRVLVFLPQEIRAMHGDTLVFNCRLAKPEPIEGFAYDRFLASRGIGAICYRPQYVDVREGTEFTLTGSILTLKEKIVDRLALLVPEPHAAFLSGLLFGGSSSLSSDMKDDFSRTGTSHILAASGFNVSLFTAVFLGWILGTRLGRPRALFVTTVLLLLFVVMAGATPAVVRAALMAGVVLVGKGIRRKASLANAMILAAAIMLFFNPLILLDDVGFQLSFVATAALLFVAPKWDKAFGFLPTTLGVRESFVGSLAAITLTLPIVLWHFGAVSIVAPLINLLILPMIPYTMAAMMIALAIGAVSVEVGILVALPAWAMSSVILHLISWFAALPVAIVSTEHADVLAIVALACLFLFAFFSRHVRYVRSHPAR